MTLGLCLQTGLESARDCDGECSNLQAAKMECVAARATSLNLSEPAYQTVVYEIKNVSKTDVMLVNIRIVKEFLTMRFVYLE